MRNFRKFIATLLLVFAFVFVLSFSAFADETEIEEIPQQEVDGEEQTEEVVAEEVEETTDEVTDTEEDEAVAEVPKTEADEDGENEEDGAGIEEYAKTLIDKITSSSFVASIVTFVTGILAVLLMNGKLSTKIIGFVGDKADTALVKKRFQEIEELVKNNLGKQDEIAEAVNELSATLMLIAEYLPSVPSTVKGEMFKTFSFAKDSGKKILDSLQETKARIEEAVASIPAIDTSALTKVLADAQKKADAEAEDHSGGTIDLG